VRRSTFDESRDYRIANESSADRALMCCANGCPNRWSVDAGNGRSCSAHAWAGQHLWPRITQEQLDAETSRALRNAAPPAPIPVDMRRVRDALRRYQAAVSRPGMSRQWAHRLKDREARGDALTPTQREMWRAAINAHALLDSAANGQFVPIAAITDALRVTGDIPANDFSAIEIPVEAYE
jgi:hypothetical protein